MVAGRNENSTEGVTGLKVMKGFKVKVRESMSKILLEFFCLLVVMRLIPYCPSVLWLQATILLSDQIELT